MDILMQIKYQIKLNQIKLNEIKLNKIKSIYHSDPEEEKTKVNIKQDIRQDVRKKVMSK